MSDRPGPVPATGSDEPTPRGAVVSGDAWSGSTPADSERPFAADGADRGVVDGTLGRTPDVADGSSDGDPHGGTELSVADVTDEADGTREGRRSFLGELPVLVLVAIVLVIVLKAFVVQAFYIPSRSMEPTLQVGDRILVNEMVYRFRDIRRGEVVVFDGVDSWVSDPGAVSGDGSANPVRRFARTVGSTLGVVPPNDKIYIKRVVGVAGDRVTCCDDSGRLTVNGVPLDEEGYLFPGDEPSDRRFDVDVPPGRIFVLGDHRAMSADSREHLEVQNGTVPVDKVVGRAFVVIWPFGNWSGMARPGTFEQEQLAADALAGPLARPATAGATAARRQVREPRRGA